MRRAVLRPSIGVISTSQDDEQPFCDSVAQRGKAGLSYGLIFSMFVFVSDGHRFNCHDYAFVTPLMHVYFSIFQLALLL